MDRNQLVVDSLPSQVNGSAADKAFRMAPVSSMYNANADYSMLVGPNFRVGKKIGCGNFGELRLGRSFCSLFCYCFKILGNF